MFHCQFIQLQFQLFPILEALVEFPQTNYKTYGSSFRETNFQSRPKIKVIKRNTGNPQDCCPTFTFSREVKSKQRRFRSMVARLSENHARARTLNIRFYS